MYINYTSVTSPESKMTETPTELRLHKPNTVQQQPKNQDGHPSTKPNQNSQMDIKTDLHFHKLCHIHYFVEGKRYGSQRKKEAYSILSCRETQT